MGGRSGNDGLACVYRKKDSGPLQGVGERNSGVTDVSGLGGCGSTHSVSLACSTLHIAVMRAFHYPFWGFHDRKCN